MRRKYLFILFLLLTSNLVNAQQLSVVEYFFDTDPGFGSGRTITLSGSLVDTSLSLDLTGLAPGLHTLYVRCKNDNGKWGLSYQSSLQVNSGSGNGNGSVQLTMAEYYFDWFWIR